jgi:hypothetical protein
MDTVRWDCMGENPKEKRKIDKRRERRQYPESHYKYKKYCVAGAFYDEKNLDKPAYCKGWFYTNIEKKMTCSSFCSVDWHDYLSKKKK